MPQVYLQQTPRSAALPSIIAGWVSDSTGLPLAGVRVRLSASQVQTTGPDGVFRFDPAPAGTHTLRLEKKGYDFSPASLQVRAVPGSFANLGVEFSALPEALLVEAAKDLGMPYNLQRGCPSPFEPCGGPYHGFFSGDCTDLVMDAYLSGLDFNIQIALERDAYNQPRHYYRWRNARSAHDMWRYFAYTGQILLPDQPHQIGDMVFFDWEMDGIVDHVAIVSEVSSRGQPKKMMDATGVIDENPSGLATELDWKPYHTTRTPGHARWRGISNPAQEAVPPSQVVVNIALDSIAARFNVWDAKGRLAGASQTTESIPGSTALNTPLGQVISLLHPRSQAGEYRLEITSPVAVEYQLGIQIIQGGLVQASESYLQPIGAGETLWIPVNLWLEGGQLRLSLPPSH
jgi:hypothetical protein